MLTQCFFYNYRVFNKEGQKVLGYKTMKQDQKSTRCDISYVFQDFPMFPDILIFPDFPVLPDFLEFKVFLNCCVS